jgi:hypothetical protein
MSVGGYNFPSSRLSLARHGRADAARFEVMEMRCKGQLKGQRGAILSAMRSLSWPSSNSCIVEQMSLTDFTRPEF